MKFQAGYTLRDALFACIQKYPLAQFSFTQDVSSLPRRLRLIVHASNGWGYLSLVSLLERAEEFLTKSAFLAESPGILPDILAEYEDTRRQIVKCIYIYPYEKQPLLYVVDLKNDTIEY